MGKEISHQKTLGTTSNTVGTTQKNNSASTAQSTQKPKSTQKIAPIPLAEICRELGKNKIKNLLSAYDKEGLKKVFSDHDLMSTGRTFLQNDLNECKTACALYMHRNTLIYRLNKIYRLTGLDIRRYDMATTFEVLALIFEERQEEFS
jgi:DNA-binding PucR family transcriptional regulator